MERDESYTPELRKLFRIGAIVLIVVGLFVAVEAVKSFKEYRFVGADIQPHNTISVSGEGEAFAAPDVARFTFSIIEEAETVEQAQQAATEREKEALNALKGLDVSQQDIKTVSYNLRPRYEYRGNGVEIRRPEGRRVLVGYEVRETISVKLDDISKAGDALAQMGQVGVQNISGLSFEINDEENVRAEAREKAIEAAKEKAERLADDLGVTLGRVVNFSESGISPMVREFGRGADAAMESSAPSVPSGENRIVSNVHVTYEIR